MSGHYPFKDISRKKNQPTPLEIAKEAEERISRMEDDGTITVAVWAYRTLAAEVIRLSEERTILLAVVDAAAEVTRLTDKEGNQ
jgi:hypothetical protein